MYERDGTPTYVAALQIYSIVEAYIIAYCDNSTQLEYTNRITEFDRVQLKL